eukprot:TRINITY_DN32590_c0_g1_i1.p1 TRINITY_DN32590_c0_g1~~TRINITY_DN32590_c0_g1_i1.p1  ORF type:complete len:738 (+),score=221.45 TRINITY_DN32590_c0_g1_i1:62-2215(+)
MEPSAAAGHAPTLLSEAEHQRLLQKHLAERAQAHAGHFVAVPTVDADGDAWPTSPGGWGRLEQHRRPAIISPPRPRPMVESFVERQERTRHTPHEHSERRQRPPRVGSREFTEAEAERKRQRMELLRQQKLEREHEECTFTPRITQTYTARERRGKSAFERLSQDTRDAWRRQKERERLEAQKENTFPFHPQLSKTTELYVSKRDAGHDPIPLSDKLYQEASHRERRQQRKRLEHAEKEVAGLFRPRVNTDVASARGSPERASVAERRPLYERVEEVRVQREQRLDSLRKAESKSLTFRPHIHPLSRAVAAERGPLLERLQQQASVGPRVDHQVRKVPSIGHRTRQIAEQRSEHVQHRDFVERQQAEDLQRQRRLDTLREESSAATRPSVRLTQGQIKRSLQEMSSKWEARNMQLQEMRNEATRNFFRPNATTDSGSSRRRSFSARPQQRRTDVGEPVRRADDVARLQRERARQHDDACPFAPTIDACSRRLAEKRGGSRTVNGVPYAKNPRVLQDAERLWSERLQEKEEDFKFRPHVIPRPDPTGPVRVAGMAQFLHRQGQAKEMEAERRRRAEDAYRVKGSALSQAHREDRGGGVHTVPQPFALSTGSRKRSSSAPVYSFRPRTNEAQREAVLRRMLQDDSSAESPDPLHSPSTGQAWVSAGVPSARTERTEPASSAGRAPREPSVASEVAVRHVDLRASSQWPDIPDFGDLGSF